MELFIKIVKSVLLMIFLLISAAAAAVSIFATEILYYAGFSFPILLVICIFPLSIGVIRMPSFSRTALLGMIPWFLATITYWIYLFVVVGFFRLKGWLSDLGTTLLIFTLIWFVAVVIGWLFQNRGGKEKAGLTVLLIFSFVIATCFQIYFTSYYHLLKYDFKSLLGPQDMREKSYNEVFSFLWDYLNKHYPYHQYKQINWEEIKIEFEDRLADISADEEFHSLIREMVTHLQDPHMKVLSPNMDKINSDYTDMGIQTVEIDKKWLVKMVHKNSAADLQQIKPGFTLLKINGTQIDDLLLQQSDLLLNAKEGSIRDQRFGNQLRMQQILAGKAGTEMALTFSNHQEIEQTKSFSLIKYQKPREANFSSKRLAGDLGYIRLKRMPVNIPRFISQFDNSLKELQNTNGLIIDLRGNLGGTIIVADQILGHFADKKVQYGYIRNAHDDLFPLWIVPRRPSYYKPVILLIDETCMSAGEYFAFATKVLKSVKRIGRPTKGVVSGPSRKVIIPGDAVLKLYSSGLADLQGRFVVEWKGVEPDILVPYKPADLNSGKDSMLEHAIEILKGEK